MSATVVIKKNGSDISSSVMFSQTRFTALANGVPGPFEMVCRDTDRTLSFVTGDEITLDIDGIRMFGGWVMEIGRTHAFEADDTSNTGTYANRYWNITGVDYNILFDKRVIRDTSNYLSNDFATFAGTIKDGTALKNLMASYVNIPGAFDTTTYMDDVAYIGGNTTKDKAFMQQGTKLRDQWEKFAIWSGAVWYIDPNKNFHWHSLESSVARWGFSDQPNNVVLTGASGFQSAYYGFREVEATEDGSVIVNDALIWGGSEWSDGMVFARAQNSASITAHNRWQVGEVHIGEDGFGIQDGVDARANAIVDGPPGADALGQLKGLRYPQWSFKFSWHDSNVPVRSGNREHLTAGQLVTIQMNTFGVSVLLPLRSLTMSFPDLNPATDPSLAYVRFDGEFNLNISDPFKLWAFLIKRKSTPSTGTGFASVNDGSTGSSYGAQYQGTPTPTPNGVATVFTIPFGYISGQSEVYKDGLILQPGTDYTESDPGNGTYTFTVAPSGGSVIFIRARTLTS